MTASISQAESPQAIALARALFVEYAQWLAVDLCFQGFGAELATLPGAYAPPAGRLLLAGDGDSAFGCIALRPLDDDGGEKRMAVAGAAPAPNLADETLARAWVDATIMPTVGGSTVAPTVGEIKRLYVQPAFRNGGWGRALVAALLEQARAIGYRELRLDTLDWMSAARKLYASHGFAPCAAYYFNPLPGVVYMSRTL